MRQTIVFLACVLAAAPAMAASFDCNKASTPIEYAICGDPGLSQADETVAKAFFAARDKLSKPASAIVLDNQRKWIDFVARACTTDAEPMVSGRYDADGIACLTNLYDNRARSLHAIGPVGGLVVYPVERFETMRDPEPESWNKVATTVISYAQIDGQDAEAKAFNAYMRRLAAPALDAPPDAEMAGTSDYDLAISVEAVTPARIAVSLSDYFYGHGAAHGNYSITYGQYLRRQGRAMVAEDVFAGRNWAVELEPLIVARLRQDAEKNTGDADAIWEDLSDLAEIIADPGRWDVKKDGIAFQFEPYEVSAYAYGAPEALMSWQELAPWLEPGAVALLTGN